MKEAEGCHQTEGERATQAQRNAGQRQDNVKMLVLGREGSWQGSEK